MDNYSKFPDYIYSPSTGYLYITKTNEKCQDASEYSQGPKLFHGADEAKKYLEENNLKGILGVRHTN